MMQSTPVKIKSIKKLPTTDRYDITVEDTHNFFANGVLIHNTSFRSANLKKTVPLTFSQKFINFVLRKKVYTEKAVGYEYATGSRRVTLKQDTEHKGFHGSDAFRFEVTEKLKPALKEGMTMYGEIFGWVNGSPIMGSHDTGKLGKEYKKKYGSEMVFSYGVPKGEYGTLVYRITQENEDGSIRDYMWNEIEEYSKVHGFNINTPLLTIEDYDGDSKKLRELVESMTDRPGVLDEDPVDPTHISEGVILHVEKNGRVHYVKSKSMNFKILEGILKLDGVVDAEEAASQETQENADEEQESSV